MPVRTFERIEFPKRITKIPSQFLLLADSPGATEYRLFHPRRFVLPSHSATANDTALISTVSSHLWDFSSRFQKPQICFSSKWQRWKHDAHSTAIYTLPRHPDCSLWRERLLAIISLVPSIPVIPWHRRTYFWVISCCKPCVGGGKILITFPRSKFQQFHEQATFRVDFPKFHKQFVWIGAVNFFSSRSDGL